MKDSDIDQETSNLAKASFIEFHYNQPKKKHNKGK
jgi:hypothetical protein